jgi:hypothetical protein
MSTTLGQDHIVQFGLKQQESICCGIRFNRFTGFFYFTWSMNEGVLINLEHLIYIITMIPEILSTDHRFNQTTDKRIITANARPDMEWPI